MRWAVEIQNTTLEDRNIADLLRALGFKVVQTAKMPAFTSDAMDACGKASQAFEMAKAVRTAMTGAAGIDKEFELGAVVDYSTDPPRRHAFLEAHCAIHFTASATATVTLNPPKGLSEQELQEWEQDRQERMYQARLEEQRAKLEPVFVNPVAEKVSALLSENTQTGATLYRIYELMEGHPLRDRKNFHAMFGITVDDFQRFKDAVHNPATTGEWARHAYYDTPKSKEPMTRSEAESFVRGLSKRWLASLRKPTS